MNISKLAELAIHRGVILHSSLFDCIDHGKFFVVMGENEKELVGFFFINTDIHPFIKKQQTLLDMQFPIRRSDYSFLKYTSFIDCHQLTTFTKSNLISQIATKSAQVKGELTAEDLQLLLDAVRQSKLFSKAEKDSFFQ
ncbi:MAG: hypothetical protein RR382_05770 [Tannerellaceae bacterium]